MKHRAIEPGSPCRVRERGVTLVELLIALVIIGIVTSIALPIYTGYQQTGYRAQAMADLADCAQAMERYYTENFTYDLTSDGTSLGDLCSTDSPPQGTAVYAISLGSADATTFTLEATPVAGGAMAGEGTLSVDATGKRAETTP